MFIPPCSDFNAMRDTDVRAVDPATLNDIRNVHIDPRKTINERVSDFICQIHNPYCFRHNKTVIKVSFSDTDTTLEDCLNGFFSDGGVRLW